MAVNINDVNTEWFLPFHYFLTNKVHTFYCKWYDGGYLVNIIMIWWYDLSACNFLGKVKNTWCKGQWMLLYTLCYNLVERDVLLYGQETPMEGNVDQTWILCILDYSFEFYPLQVTVAAWSFAKRGEWSEWIYRTVYTT